MHRDHLAVDISTKLPPWPLLPQATPCCCSVLKDVKSTVSHQDNSGSEHRLKSASLRMGGLKAIVHAWVCERVCVCESTYEHPLCDSCVWTHICVCVCRCYVHACLYPISPACTAFNFEWRQMLRRPILRQWKEPFLSTYRSMGSHSIRKSETISTQLMTPFWGAGEFWPQGRRVAGGGARKSIQAEWGISLTAFIMSALHFFSVLSGKYYTFQIAYCSRVLNALSLWSSFS